MSIDEQAKQQQERQIWLLRQVRMALKNDDFEEAIGSLKQLVDLAHATGDLGAEGRHLGNLALIYYRLKQSEDALYYFTEALELARQDDDQLTQSGLLGNIGNVLREMGRFEEAVQSLRQALTIAEAIDDVRGRGIWLGNLGLVFDDLKDADTAIGLHQESVDIARELHDQRGLASRLTNLGNSYAAKGDLSTGLSHLQESAAISEELGDVGEQLVRLVSMGNLNAQLARSTSRKSEQRNRFTAAFGNYTKALRLIHQLRDPVSEAMLLRTIADVLLEVRQYDRAIEFYNAALAIFTPLEQTEQIEVIVDSLEVAILLRDQAISVSNSD
jgi:tetratricopeptide (TPR) repeat protein